MKIAYAFMSLIWLHPCACLSQLLGHSLSTTKCLAAYSQVLVFFYELEKWYKSYHSLQQGSEEGNRHNFDSHLTKSTRCPSHCLQEQGQFPSASLRTEVCRDAKSGLQITSLSALPRYDNVYALALMSMIQKMNAYVPRLIMHRTLCCV